MAEERTDHLASTKSAAQRIVDRAMQGQATGHLVIMHDDMGRQIVLDAEEMPKCKVCNHFPREKGMGYDIQLGSVFIIICEVCAKQVVEGENFELTTDEIAIIHKEWPRVKAASEDAERRLEIIRNWPPPY